MKHQYLIDAPDQRRLKRARLLIEAILRQHDLAGVVVLHTPGMTEFFYDLRPTYSCAWIDEAAGVARFKSKAADYGGDTAAQLHDQAATANMTRGLADELCRAAGMFAYVAKAADKAFRAEHTPAVFTPDPMEGKPR